MGSFKIEANLFINLLNKIPEVSDEGALSVLRIEHLRLPTANPPEGQKRKVRTVEFPFLDFRVRAVRVPGVLETLEVGIDPSFWEF